METRTRSLEKARAAYDTIKGSNPSAFVTVEKKKDVWIVTVRRKSEIPFLTRREAVRKPYPRFNADKYLTLI